MSLSLRNEARPQTAHSMPPKSGSIEHAQIVSREAKRARRDERLQEHALLRGMSVSAVVASDAMKPMTFEIGTPLVDHCGMALAAMRAAHEKPALSEFAAAMLDPSNSSALMATQTQQSAEFGIDRKTVVSKLERLASTAWLCDRFLRKSFFEAMGSARQVRILQPVESLGYDETPLPMRAVVDSKSPSSSSSAAPSAILPTTVCARIPRNRGAMSAKIFQVKQEWGCVAEIATTTGPKFVFIVGRSLSHLQMLHKNSAACIFGALAEANATSLAERVGGFPTTRMVFIDRHPSNILAEKSIKRCLKKLNRDHETMITECRQHMMQTIRNSALANFDGTISGMINMALAINQQGCFRDFRDCIFEVVRSRCRVIVGYPSPGIILRRALILKWFLPKVNDGHVIIKSLLDSLPCGDWSNDEHLEMYIEPGMAFDENALASRAAYLITEALAHRTWTLYMRSKWMGGEESSCEVALGFLIGGVLKPAFRRFCEKKGSVKGPLAASVALAVLDGGRQLGDDHEEQDPQPMVAGEGEDGDMPGGGVGDGSWAARNDQRRKVAMQFLDSTGPSALGRIVVVRMLMSVAQGMQAKEMQVGSMKWSKKQAAKAARVASRAAPNVLSRDYAALVHARGDIEQEAFRKIRVLFRDPRVWMLVPESEWSNNLKAEAFVSLSRIGALTEKLLARAHSRTPWRLFLVAAQPDLATTIASTPRCLMDKWSAKFVEQNDITSEAAQMKLLLHIMMLQPNTNDLEVGHSHIRRIVKKRVQCAPASVAETSAKWIVRQCRRDAEMLQEPKREDERRRVQEPVQDGEQPVRGGGGGPWRAFVRRRRSNNLREVANLYRVEKAIPDSEVMRACIEEGVAGAARRRGPGLRKGETSFGPKHKSIEEHRLQLSGAAHTRPRSTWPRACPRSRLGGCSPSLARPRPDRQHGQEVEGGIRPPPRRRRKGGRARVGNLREGEFGG